MRIGETVRMRQGSDIAQLLGEAADLAGKIGDVWTDDRGERISVVYEDAQAYAMGLSAAEFERVENH